MRNYSEESCQNDDTQKPAGISENEDEWLGLLCLNEQNTFCVGEGLP